MLPIYFTPKWIQIILSTTLLLFLTSETYAQETVAALSRQTLYSFTIDNDETEYTMDEFINLTTLPEGCKLGIIQPFIDEPYLIIFYFVSYDDSFSSDLKKLKNTEAKISIFLSNDSIITGRCSNVPYNEGSSDDISLGLQIQMFIQDTEMKQLASYNIKSIHLSTGDTSFQRRFENFKSAATIRAMLVKMGEL